MGSYKPRAFFVALMAGSMVAFQIHTRSWRHSGMRDLVWLAGAVLVGLALFAPAALKPAPGGASTCGSASWRAVCGGRHGAGTSEVIRREGPAASPATCCFV